MTADLECDRLDCTKPAVSSMGSQVFCEDHFEALMAPIRARVFTQPDMHGVGRQRGPLRAEYGPLVAELECTTCQAQWVGPLGDPCEWCKQHRQAMIDGQAQRLLRPPDLDAHNETARAAWLARLIVGIDAGVITKDDARLAYNRQVQRAA